MPTLLRNESATLYLSAQQSVTFTPSAGSRAKVSGVDALGNSIAPRTFFEVLSLGPLSADTRLVLACETGSVDYSEPEQAGEGGGGGASSFADLEGAPEENADLAAALDARALSSIEVVEVEGTSYIFTFEDNDKHVKFLNATSCSATIPPDLAAGFNCLWSTPPGAGPVTFVAGSGVTINSQGGALTSSGENASGAIVYSEPDNYLLSGSLGTLEAALIVDFEDAVLDIVGASLVVVTTTGTPIVGQVLTFSLPAGLTGTFQVTRNGADIPTTGLSSAGVNSFAYTLVTADASTSINVRVSSLRYLGTAVAVPAEVVSAPLVATLTDNFNDNVRDAAKWDIGYFKGTASAQVVSENTGQLAIPALTSTAGTNVSGYVSVNVYDLTASSAFVRYAQASSASILQDMFFALYSSSANAVFWRMRGANLNAITRNSDSETVVGSNITYSATTHAWLRIRESAGTIFWDTAPNTASNPPIEADWVNQRSAAKPAGLILDAVKVALNGGTNGSTGTSGTTRFDGFNTAI